MSQKSEDSIERFFRKGVVQQDKTFMERDWQSLEKMLDEEAMTAASVRAGKMKIAGKVVMAVVLLSFLFLIGVEKDHSENIVQMQAAVGASGPRVEVKSKKSTADLHSSKTNAESSNERNAGRQITGIKTSIDLSPRSQTALVNKTIANNSFGANQHLTINPTSSSTTQAIEYGSTGKPVAVAEVSVTEVEHEGSINGVENSPVIKPALPEKSEEPTPVLNTEDAQEITQEQSKTSYPKFNVTALVSPDFTTTSFSKYSKPTGAFGLLIGYRVSKRFTVMAGVTKSLKRYEGYGDQYSPPEGYWQNRTNGVVPDQVEGKCGIIEVPVLIQFDALQKTKSRIFLSIGVSSYFMRSEHYEYKFTEPNPGAASSWTAREPTNYLFKIGHLSAGYDKLIGKNFSIGIEPFLKVPFEGIGWSNVSLYSTGAYVNVRYNILSNQKQ